MTGGNATPAPGGLFIGAYAAAPSLSGWDPTAEAEYLASVLELDGVAGLELPFTHQLHKFDEPWLLRMLPPGARFILTGIPGTMDLLASNPVHGLASTSPDGRREAVSFVRELQRAAQRLNEVSGGPAVHAIQLHAAPVAVPGASSAAALAASLAEIAAWDWSGARLVLEHCDAFRPSQRAAKGFMALEDEVEAVLLANQAGPEALGMSVNWGRSVIEQRDPDAALRHVELLAGAALLGGFTVSGCADVDTKYGVAWADVHVPPASEPAASVPGGAQPDHRFLDEASLLTFDRLSGCLAAAGTSEGFSAIKVAAPPQSPVQDRIAAVKTAVDLVKSAQTSLASRPPR